MEENKMLEKIWSEAQGVEVPEELSPERMKARIEAEKQTTTAKNKSEQKNRTWRFHRHGGSRVAAAAIVLVASLGAYGVANSQSIVTMPQSSQEGSDTQAETTDKAQSQISDGVAAGTEVSGAEAPADDTVVKVLGDYRLAEDYEEVQEMILELAEAREYHYAFAETEGVADGAPVDEMAAMEYAGEDVQKEAAAADLAGSSSQNAQQFAEKADYSTTNLQVTGVDESDIVKTDGRYIYIATSDQVQIVDAGGETPRQLSSITPELSGNMDRICEMYVADGRLMLIVQTEETDGLPDGTNEVDALAAQKKMAVCYDMAYLYDAEITTEILTYDIANPANAKLLGTFRQEGSYNTSRKIGDQIYLFTNYGYPMLYDYMRTFDAETEGKESERAETAAPDRDEIVQKLPKIQGETIPENCIYLPKDACESGVVISSMDVKEPETVLDRKLIFSGYSTMYVTKNSVILYRSDYSEASDRACTKLTRFSIGDGHITADCAEAVVGYIEDTFAIHETGDGYVYVLTTDYTPNGNTNQLYVLDEKLKIYGKIEHIADGERVYAARFVDDIGYFVTYRNMDPLFTVDFSDPAHPTLIGELEIPGFSDYLQFWDDTHLIGVGEERKEEDSEFVGIKVSLYDISDPTDVKESSKLVLEDACYAPASNVYKALLADSRKNVIAFLTQDKGEKYQVSERILTVEDGALKQAVADRITTEEVYCGLTNYRNLYIGERLYLACEGLVIVYDMTNGFERTATCILR